MIAELLVGFVLWSLRVACWVAFERICLIDEGRRLVENFPWLVIPVESLGDGRRCYVFLIVLDSSDLLLLLLVERFVFLLLPWLGMIAVLDLLHRVVLSIIVVSVPRRKTRLEELILVEVS